MASNIKKSITLKNAELDAMTTFAGTGVTVKIYGGGAVGQPTSPAVAVTDQLLLTTNTIAGVLGAASVNGVLTLGTISDGTGTAAATTVGTTANWFRLSTSGGVAFYDGTVGATASDINLSPDALIKTNQVVSLTSVTITSGN